MSERKADNSLEQRLERLEERHGVSNLQGVLDQLTEDKNPSMEGISEEMKRAIFKGLLAEVIREGADEIDETILLLLQRRRERVQEVEVEVQAAIELTKVAAEKGMEGGQYSIVRPAKKGNQSEWLADENEWKKE